MISVNSLLAILTTIALRRVMLGYDSSYVIYNQKLATTYMFNYKNSALHHTTAQTKYEMQCRFLLDVVVTQRTSVLQLLASENQTLLVWRNAFLILNFGFHVVDRVG